MEKVTPKTAVAKTNIMGTTQLPKVINTAEERQHTALALNAQFKTFAVQQGVTLTPKEIMYGKELVADLTQQLAESKTQLDKVNLQTFLGDVKDCAKLGLSKKNKHIYFDIRNNGKTNQIDIRVKRQYQGIKHILANFYTKKAIRFLDGVVCKGDVFEWHKDFSTGLQVIDKHEEVCKERNKLENIEYAYAVAFVKEDDQTIPYAIVVDKDRILRARESATTKNVWDKDTRAMAIKTAYWVLKELFDPFMVDDIEISNAIANTEYEMSWDSKEKVIDVIDVENLPIDEVENEQTFTEAEMQEAMQEPQLDDLPPIADQYACADCGAIVDDRVLEFSNSKYGKTLCYNCQKKQK